MLSVIGHNAARGPCLAGRATTRTSIRNGCALQQQYGRRKGVILCAQSATEDSEVAEDDGISVAATKQVRLRTAKGSRLAVSIYPSFVYNAQGGGGIGVAEVGDEGLINVKFDAKDIYIPDLYFRTTTFLGLPLPWPFRIAVEPKRLEGTVDFESGDVDLEFVADFKFTAGSVYKAPNLKVLTHLTTGTVQGRQHSGTGQRLINGKGRIVGVANLDPTGDSFLDRFLMLPADCYADLQADFELV